MTLSLPLNTQTLVSQITGKLREQIITGQLAPGSKIKQDEYSEAFGVSRTPLREAFRLLEAQGWIQIRPRSGVEVSGFSPAEVQEIVIMRLLLEPVAIRATAQFHNDKEEKALARRIEQWPTDPSSGNDETGAYDVANRQFHFALYGMTESLLTDPLHTALLSYWERYSRYRRVYHWREAHAITRSDEEHVRILDAWTARDADRTERELAHHILAAGTSLITALDDNHGFEYSAVLRALADRYEFTL